MKLFATIGFFVGLLMSSVSSAEVVFITDATEADYLVYQVKTPEQADCLLYAVRSGDFDTTVAIVYQLDLAAKKVFFVSRPEFASNLGCLDSAR